MFNIFNADNIETQYKKAMSYYKHKDFSQSYKMFSVLYFSKFSDAKLNFYLGR